VTADALAALADTIADHLAHELIATVRVTRHADRFEVRSSFTGDRVDDWNPEVVCWDGSPAEPGTGQAQGIDWQGIGADYRNDFETYETMGSAADGGGRYVTYHLGELLEELEPGAALLIRQGVIDALPDGDDDGDSDSIGWYLVADLQAAAS
jgi:hypothetical protein